MYPQAPLRRGFFVYAQAMESLTDIRVRYAETDAMGIVHHGAPSAIASRRRSGSGRTARGAVRYGGSQSGG